MAYAAVSDARERIEAINEVATLPTSMVRILSVVQDESATALDLASEIQQDQSLTLKILGIVNSSFYGFHRKIHSIPDAVVILGFAEVERIALAISVINLFGRDQSSVRTLNMLWRHSLACSVVAGNLETLHRRNLPNINGAHVAGLLHDIGKAVIAQYFPEAIHPIHQLVQEDGVDPCDAEREVLDGLSHCEIGAALAERWSLPTSIVESILMHHSPDQVPEDHVLTHVTHLSNMVCHNAGILSMNMSPTLEPDQRSANLFNVDDDAIDKMVNRLEGQRGIIGAMAAGGTY